ncbi:MAG: hypothetical protein KGY50_00800 [Candidatus Thermoplasmatota archaeon]|nr:hypothetical protein [Candidatus Thermoplasmatota archaeon]
MLETFNLLITDSWRLFRKNFSQSPVLYLSFFAMAIFSVLMIAGISLVFVHLQISIDVGDLFFVIFGIFLLKAAYDFYHLFITKQSVVYLLSTQKKHSTIISEIAFTILWSNLGYWALLSGFYTLIIANFNLSFDGTEAYLFLTAAVAIGSIIGITTALLLFSKRRLLLPFLYSPLILLWMNFNWIYLFCAIGIYVFVLLIGLSFGLDSFLFHQHKNRSHHKEHVSFPGSIWSICVKEILFLWRERLLISIIFSSSFLGVSSGYLAVFGESLFLPEEIRIFTTNLSLETYAFVGIYVLVVYASVFITLNLFLNEERTVWLLKLLPVSTEIFVYGKISALILSFVASIPFLAFFLAFTQGESAFIVIWLFLFSFLSGIFIGAPLGSKYVGGKSDVLLLYSVSLVMLLVCSLGFALVRIALMINVTNSFLLLSSVMILLVLLLIPSVKISAFFLKQTKTE